jgi:hypothetical protein
LKQVTMRHETYDRLESPVEVCTEIIDGKWKGKILYYFLNDTKRYGAQAHPRRNSANACRASNQNQPLFSFKPVGGFLARRDLEFLGSVKIWDCNRFDVG